MAAKSASRSGRKKKYYKPHSALEKIRHRLADGTPTHSLLHYLHGREKLPKDITIIAEAAEKLHQVGELIQEVRNDKGIDEVTKTINRKFPELAALVGNGATKMIKGFVAEARRALTIMTTKEPEEG